MSTSDAVVVRSDDPAITRALAARLARVAEPGDLLCLIGELGAGKTQFAKGFGAGLGVTDVVNSPTFVLMTEYDGRLPLFHLDLYRLADAADALAGGLLDERQRDGVTLVEWAERLGEAVPDARLEVRIDGTGDEPRSIRLEAGDAAPSAVPGGGGRCGDGRMSGDTRRDGRRAADPRARHRHTQAVIAVGAPDGEPLGASTWSAGYRHGETLLPNIGRLLGEANLRRSRLRGSSSGRVRGRSRGCGSGSRRPRAWRVR